MSKTKTTDTQTDDDAAVDPDDETVTLGFRGLTFEVPKRRGRWPVEAVLQFGRGNLPRAFNELLGADDWKRLKTVAATLDDFNAFALPAVEQLHTECIL
jgi:hypothetical protein